jgi:hypothetical protein
VYSAVVIMQLERTTRAIQKSKRRLINIPLISRRSPLSKAHDAHLHAARTLFKSKTHLHFIFGSSIYQFVSARGATLVTQSKKPLTHPFKSKSVIRGTGPAIDMQICKSKYTFELLQEYSLICVSLFVQKHSKSL